MKKIFCDACGKELCAGEKIWGEAGYKINEDDYCSSCYSTIKNIIERFKADKKMEGGK